MLLVILPTVCARAQEGKSGSHATIIYELYSWRDTNGEWCFSVLGMTERAKLAEEIFDKDLSIQGVATLKRKISKMPLTTKLIWMKNPWKGTSVKGTESVVWPPEGTMNEIKQFAATKHIEVAWAK